MKFRKFRFKKVKNTNNTAISIIKRSNFKFGMITSETQTKGKGKYGKKWISHKGNLFVSFFHQFKNINKSMSALTRINCLLVKKALNKYYKKKIRFKKPNDLLINNKKICGILQETISIYDDKFLVVGIGINLFKSPTIKNYPTTNLFDLTNFRINKVIFENELKVLFEKNLSKLYKINNNFNKK